MEQSALIIEVPEAEEAVAAWRMKHDPVAAAGVPAHITILFPFAPPSRFGPATLETLRTMAADVSPFEYSLTSLGEFPGAVWLRPEPDQPFRDLTQRVCAAFPEYLPYEGRFPDTQPHLTVALSGSPDEHDSLRAQLDAQVGELLPIRCVARALSVVLHDASGQWSRTHRLEFTKR